VAVRVLLVIASVLVIGWTGVLLRDHQVGKDAALRAIFAPESDPAARDRDLSDLEDAQFLDPSASWKLALANYRLATGDARRAAAEAEELVRAEPENIAAWGTLLRATQDGDPARAREAAAAIRRLNPLAARG